jgi:tetratricopeptide (TPR) repeat protein
MEKLSGELERIDEIFDENRLEETLELLKKLDQNNVEVLWRVVRVEYQLAKTVKSKSDRVELIKEAYEQTRKALEIDDNCANAHYFYAILLDEYSALYGLRERALKLKTVKKHMIRAVELDPKDPMCHYVLGFFIYSMADLNWFTRKIVEAAFTKP